MEMEREPIGLVRGNTDPKLVWHGVRVWETFEGSAQILPEVPIIGEFDLKDTVLYALKPDSHPGEFEVHLVYDGTMEMWVDAPENPLTIRRGFGIMTRPGQLHGGVHESLRPARWTWLRFVFPAEKKQALPGISAVETFRIRNLLAQSRTPVFSYSHELGDCLRRLLEEHRRGLVDVQTAARGVFLEFLAWLQRDLLRASNTGVPSGVKISPEIQRSITYVDRNIGMSFSVDQMAEAACLSPSQFRRLFHEQMGLGPHDYLVHRRVENSKGMLLNSKKSVTDIALDLGFASSAHFAAVFRRFVGITPSQFREQRNTLAK
jgi:AraC-like DNA-binding protein